MSPLTNQNNGLTIKKNASNKNELIINANGEDKIYSMQELYNLRHNRNQAPNLNNRSVLQSISRITNDLNAIKLNSGDAVNVQRRLQNNRLNGRSASSSHTQNEKTVLHRERGGMGSIRMTLKNDVTLRKADNAWKPSFLNRQNDDQMTELCKQVRSILNKLTAQNFSVLSEQFENLTIDTKEKLIEVINLVFNKAVNEPTFSEEYAKLCQYLSQCSQKIDTTSEQAYFKRTLINKCQIEFEEHVANKNTTTLALTPLTEKLKICKQQSDLNGINETKAQIAEEESNLRRRLVSTVRFIGELFKLGMLTTNIMNKCIECLIRSQTNEKLECVCKLLTTVGGKLERLPNETNKDPKQFLDLTKYINQLNRIASNKNKNCQVTSRIKFMIMDLIELRNNRWMPRIRCQS